MPYYEQASKSCIRCAADASTVDNSLQIGNVTQLWQADEMMVNLICERVRDGICKLRRVNL